MSWRDDLRQASFRGVSFKVLSATTEVGRRIVMHEVPFNDVSYFEDFGRSAGVYTVVGYVVQNKDNAFNYFAERDALIGALSEYGAGTLIHPFYGERQVVLSGKARVDESFAEGGIARFNMVFTDAGESQLPLQFSDHKTAVGAAADAMTSKAGDKFKEVYRPDGPNFMTSAAGMVADVKAAMRAVRNTLYRVHAQPVSILSSMMSFVNEVVATVDAVVETPTSLVAAIRSTFAVYGLLPTYVSGEAATSGTVVGKKDDGESGVNAPLGVMTYGDSGLDFIPQTTPSRVQQQDNRNATIMLVRTNALAEALRASVEVEYTSYEQALAMMSRLTQASDDFLSFLGGLSGSQYSNAFDEMYTQIHDSKPTVIRAMLDLGASLPMILGYRTPAEPCPSLHIAHQVYGDLGREQEIVGRNPVKMLHPGFPSQNQDVEVLSE